MKRREGNLKRGERENTKEVKIQTKKGEVAQYSAISTQS